MIIKGERTNMVEINISIGDLVNAIREHIKSQLPSILAKSELQISVDGRVFSTIITMDGRSRKVDTEIVYLDDVSGIKLTDNMKKGIKLLNMIDNYDFYEKTTK